MIINEILDACSKLKVEEKRVSAADYEELVIFKKDMDQWYKNIDEILGPAVKEIGEKTSPQQFAWTVNYGGIADDQILFYKKSEEKSIIVMFWPWKDEVHLTLKIACFKEE